MKSSFTTLTLTSLLSTALASLYYPPILSPQDGDILASGASFAVIWNTTIPEGIDQADVTLSTDTIRLGIYLGPDSAYENWQLYPPLNTALPPVEFYASRGPKYTDSGYGWTMIQGNGDICDANGEYAVVWGDYPNEIFSGAFKFVGDCFTG